MPLSDIVLPVAATALSGAATWRLCLRPMRNGQRCGMGSSTSSDDGATQTPNETSREVRAAEMAALRAQVRELTELS
jgi:hypothetical protein